ncbi:MAG: thiamine phosphate synthase [Pyrinomonadaceae bacterium]
MKRLGHPPYICLITPGESNPSNFETEKLVILDTVRDAIEDGVNLVQIREKALFARQLFELVRAAVLLSRSAPALILVNDRPDIAVAAGADGVHLPATSLRPDVIRRSFPPELVIGVSTHSIDEARAASDSGSDYVFFGPVFDTPGKGPALGTEALRELCTRLRPFPVIALGGIDKDNLDDAFAAGAAGIAAIRSLDVKESRLAILQKAKRFIGKAG